MYKSRWIVYFLAIIGILMINNVAHEMTHYYDLHKAGSNITEVCFLDLPQEWNRNTAVAHISAYSTTPVNSSELKAGIIGLLSAGFFMIFFFYFMFYEFHKDKWFEDEGIAT